MNILKFASVQRALLTVFYLAAAAIIISACGTSGNSEDDGRLKVTSTIGMIHDLVKKISAGTGLHQQD